ncbi:hypothetical protein BAUCODRAFT_78858, partial [Baudoinia panamericana UAMH 10762]
ADTIRILVATDNHVGYCEGDAKRGDDSWKTFHEIMCLAKARDVDMVLLAGDLFHENKPSRQSMYQVMRSLRLNCYGPKPCELEMLSDASENFAGAFNHVNYEDPDINVAIPVFSIHGNHDDPTGEGTLAPLDLLQMSGLVNYYGRTPESDNIHIKPVLLQKGRTKLALYGLSNVRDERLFRTFRDGKVKFYQPGTHREDWFNIMSVHQNHHAYTETGYLPENFLPDFLDLVIWGHEHECKIDPVTNPETNFRVMQPGSSVATSLVPGEAKPKYVAVVSVTGKDFTTEPIRLKTVRPFVTREIVLADNKEMRELALSPLSSVDMRPKITRYLRTIVEEMIEEANQEWLEARQEAGEEVEDEEDDPAEQPLPLIRLRVETTPPEGGKFELENPQRFSNHFADRVANVNDVVAFHRKRSTRAGTRAAKPELLDPEVMADLQTDSVKVSKLVQEYLAAQSLTILPQNSFSDAVTQYVDKSDSNAMTSFVKQALTLQQKHLVYGEEEEDDMDEEKIFDLMEEYKARQETAFAKGEMKNSSRKRKGSRKPRPSFWNSEDEGHWEDNPASIARDKDGNPIESAEEDEEADAAPKGKGGRGRGGKAANGATRKTPATAAKKAPAKATGGRGKEKAAAEDEEEEEEEEEDDVVMLDDDDEDEDEALFVKPAAKKAPMKKPAPAPTKANGTRGTPNGTQSKLNFAGSQPNGSTSRAGGRAAATKAAPPKRIKEPSDDEISDDDAFETPPATAAKNRARR